MSTFRWWRKSQILSVSLVCIWVLFLLPAVLLNQWFTLDIGGVFSYASDFPGNLMLALLPDTAYNHGGRYFPIYWLYNFSVFWFASTNFAAHFAVQGLLFVISLALSCYLLHRITNNIYATFAFGIIACLGGAIAENLYTIGKGEPLAYLFLITTMVIFYKSNLLGRGRSVFSFVAIGLLFSNAIWSKETSSVLLIFPIVAIITSIFVTRHGFAHLYHSAGFSRYLLLFLSVLMGFFVAKAPTLFSSHSRTEKNYVDYKIDLDLVTDNFLFYATQQPDVLAFGVAAVIFCIVVGTRIRSFGYDSLSKSFSDFIFVVSLLLMAWSYYFGMLFWRWPMGYYMFLPAIIFKFVTVYGLVYLHEHMRVWGKTIRFALFGVFTLSVYALAHSYYVATSQFGYSRMYTEAISRYFAVSKPNNRLVFESFPFYAEQVFNTKLMISLGFNETRTVEGIADLLNPEVVTPKMLKLLGISQKQLDDNEMAFPRRGDYVLLMTGNKLANWSVRGATPYFSDESILKKLGAYDMELIAENRLFTPSIYLDIWTERPYFGSTYFGYKLYKVASDRPKIIWRDRHPDGWIGRAASLRVFPEFGRSALVTVSTPSFNSPNWLTVLQDDVVIQKLTLIEGREVSFETSTNIDRIPTNLRFEVENVVVPKNLKINKDKRELGVLIRVEPHQ